MLHVVVTKNNANTASAQIVKKNTFLNAENMQAKYKSINAYLMPRQAILQTPAFKNDVMIAFAKLQNDLDVLKKMNSNNQDELQKLCTALKNNYPGWNVANLADSLLGKKPAGKTSNKAAKKCYEEISKLDKQGKKLLKSKNTTDRAYGVITSDLAADLTISLNNFFADDNNLKDLDKQKAFQKSFNLILHSQDKVMQVHRAKLNKILSNIAKGLALIFSLLGMPIYALITGKNPLAFFCQHKTAREEQIETIAKATPALTSTPSSAA